MAQEGRKPIVIETTEAWNQFQPIDDVLRTRQAGDTRQRIPTTRTRVLRVLIVDDDRDTTDSWDMLVNMWGHDARTASNGAAALEMACAYQPDVLLLDVQMPKIDGYHLAQQLRRQAQVKHSLLVAMTGHGDEAHRLLGEEAGFDLYFIKPVAPLTIERILQLEQRLLADSSAASADVTIDGSQHDRIGAEGPRSPGDGAGSIGALSGDFALRSTDVRHSGC